MRRFFLTRFLHYYHLQKNYSLHRNLSQSFYIKKSDISVIRLCRSAVILPFTFMSELFSVVVFLRRRAFVRRTHAGCLIAVRRRAFAQRAFTRCAFLCRAFAAALLPVVRYFVLVLVICCQLMLMIFILVFLYKLDNCS